MKSKSITPLAVAAGMLITLGRGNAGTIIASTFNGVSSGVVSTTGLADWGFMSVSTAVNNGLFNGSAGAYSNLAFGSLNNLTPTVLTTVSATSTIGAVTVNEINAGISGQGNTSNYTFGGATAYGSYGSFAGNAGDIWNITFNNLGIGTFDIVLFMGHSAGDRDFGMTANLTGAAADVENVTNISSLGSTVAAFGTSGNSFTYNISVTTTAATDDLDLKFTAIGGSNGGAIFAGYTVAAIPEPSAALLGGLGLLALLRRRRA